MVFPTLLMTAALASFVPAQAATRPTGSTAAPPATLIPGIEGVHFQISTRREEAQKFFDQGLALVYAYNTDEAIRSFRRASEIDPASPMPYWGVALALGGNSYQGIDDGKWAQANDAIRRAATLAVRAPGKERAFVAALAKRYSTAPGVDRQALAVEYRDAMRQLYRTYPNDMHAATLLAASMMNLHPRELWTKEGTPVEGTTELVDLLERVLERDPDHVGANHLYIHAVEASLTPERGMASAKKLETLVPGAGHLLHMPAHIYMRTGRYAAAVAASTRAADVDRKYIEEAKIEGFYATRLFTHNLDFLASAAMMAGRFADALKAAQELTARVTPMIEQTPALEPFGAKTMFVLLRFAKWDDVLGLPTPSATAPLLTALHHFGRAVAHASLGNTTGAEQDREAYLAARKAVPADARFNLNAATALLSVADSVLDARLAAARGDTDASIAAWQKAVEAEAALDYNEPPDWFYPTRESLGAALLRARRLDEADLAFRQDLETNPNNGRSLWGRWQALRAADGDVPGTLVVRRRFQDAWAEADTTLRIEDF